MRQQRDNRGQTAFIRLDTEKCTACWNCIGKCENDVIGRISVLWHKHIKLRNNSACTGCLKCIKACDSGALIRIQALKT